MLIFKAILVVVGDRAITVQKATYNPFISEMAPKNIKERMSFFYTIIVYFIHGNHICSYAVCDYENIVKNTSKPL